MSPLLITTALPYVNAHPHLGHAWEALLGDALARHHRQRGRRVRFVSGTDENSLKNARAAERAGLSLDAWARGHALAFLDLAAELDVTYDDFVRTRADPRHALAVRALWARLRPHLYRGRYRGWYCAGCEQLVPPDEGGFCAEHGRELDLVDEENVFFRLTEFAAEIANAIEEGRLRIEPEHAREQALRDLAGARDVSVSRPSHRARDLGIAVPEDPSQTIFVWVDALCAYLTALGHGSPRSQVERYFRDGEVVHVIGKGITRFHTVLWPALLRAAELPLPHRVLVHGYVTLGGAKIAKTGTPLEPQPLIDRYGGEAIRWYLLRHLRTARDGDFSEARLREAYDAELANQLGNWVARVTALIASKHQGRVPHVSREPALAASVEALPSTIDLAFDRFAIDDALGAISALVREANRRLDAAAPWSEPDPSRGGAILRGHLDAIGAVGRELAPFLPTTSERILAAVREPVARTPPLFPRLARAL